MMNAGSFEEELTARASHAEEILKSYMPGEEGISTNDANSKN